MAAKQDQLRRKKSRTPRVDFSRGKSKTRDQFKTILIVCEDSVLAPDYFRAMKKDLGLSSVEIVGGDVAGTDPEHIVEHAKDRLKEASGGIEKVYCVFDSEAPNTGRDSRFKNALKEISASEGKIIGASSVPCFEFWVLLHYKMTTAEFKDCSEVEKTIKKYIKGYSKGNLTGAELYSELKNKTDIAIKNAKNLKVEKERHGIPNPATDIHLLVEELLNISKK